ncbi:MAG: HAD-IIB family hydrolase [Erysipelotrichaceae bacterium]|nr:HAD-IIB family hydrolase [Erysipelotrichaceae bacterium]
MQYKVMVADIDNTMTARGQSLSQNAREAIHKLREQGCYVGMASGRPIFQIWPSIKEWGFDEFDFLIGLNGASLWDGLTNETYNYFMLSPEAVKLSMELMRPFKTSPSTFEGESQIYLYDDWAYREFKARALIDVTLETDEEVFCGKERDKIMYRMAAEDMPKVEEWLAQHPSDMFDTYKTQPTLMEFCPKNCQKWYGVEQFCKLHGIKPEEVIAFGDTTNDNTMVENAGLGVCLLNGSDDTKALADVITEHTCEDDGFGLFLKEHILNN